MTLKYKFSIIILFIVTPIIFLFSCKKHEFNPTSAKLEINLKHSVDEALLEFFPKEYTNEAGNTFSVTDLKYYLSNFRLISNSGLVYYDKNIYYVDAKNPNSLILHLDSIQPATYTTISFDLGIDSNRNVTNFLPNTIENYNMAWPTTMGGGYHFMKFEGNYLDGVNTYGFAFHIGKSKLIAHFNLVLNKDLIYWNEKITLNHNLNEWFKNPLKYDMTIYETYSMDNDSVMEVIKTNGLDAFSL